MKIKFEANKHSDTAAKASAKAYRASDATVVDHPTEKMHRTAEKAHINGVEAHEDAAEELKHRLPNTSKMHQKTAKYHAELAAAHKEAADNIAELKQRANESIDMNELTEELDEAIAPHVHKQLLDAGFKKSKGKNGDEYTHSNGARYIPDSDGSGWEHHKGGFMTSGDTNSSLAKHIAGTRNESVNEDTSDLVTALKSGDTITSNALMSTILFGKIAEKMDARRQMIAKSMFKESTDLDEVALIGPFKRDVHHGLAGKASSNADQASKTAESSDDEDKYEDEEHAHLLHKKAATNYMSDSKEFKHHTDMAQKHKKYMNNESVEDLDEAAVHPADAHRILNDIGGTSKDFFQLNTDQNSKLNDHRKEQKFSGANSQGRSPARQFHMHLQKQAAKYKSNESVEDLDEASVAGKYAVQIRHKMTGKVDSKEYDAKNKSHAIKQAETEHHSSRYDVNKSPTLVKESTEDLDEDVATHEAAYKKHMDAIDTIVGSTKSELTHDQVTKIAHHNKEASKHIDLAQAAKRAK